MMQLNILKKPPLESAISFKRKLPLAHKRCNLKE